MDKTHLRRDSLTERLFCSICGVLDEDKACWAVNEYYTSHLTADDEAFLHHCYVQA